MQPIRSNYLQKLSSTTIYVTQDHSDPDKENIPETIAPKDSTAKFA